MAPEQPEDLGGSEEENIKKQRDALPRGEGKFFGVSIRVKGAFQLKPTHPDLDADT